MLIPSGVDTIPIADASLSRRVNANSQLKQRAARSSDTLIKKGEC